MNDIKETIERIGKRFDPPPEGLAELSRRRRRVDMRRRITAGTLAVVVGVGGSVLAARAFLGSSPPARTDGFKVVTFPAASTVSPTPPATTGEVKCPTPSGDSPPAVILGSTSGAAGSSIQVSGTFQTGQLWLQLLWNADDESNGHVTPPPWPPTGPNLQRELDPAAPGLMTELASVPGPQSLGDCSFRSAFTVPDVAPGRYQLLWVFGALASPPESGGFALFLSPTTFEVSP
jgi:hypothetical protein